MKIRIFNIRWDTDGDKKVLKTLPKEVYYESKSEADTDSLDDVLSNFLSDSFGYCHFGFEYEPCDFEIKNKAKVFYIYESHMGRFYHTTKKLTTKQRHCAQCGDYDWLLCEATKPQDIWDALEGEIDIDGSGGWDKDYIEEFISSIPWETSNDDKKNTATNN